MNALTMAVHGGIRPHQFTWEAAPAAARPAGEVTLLVVDDEAYALEALEKVLTGEGYRVLAASDPARALVLLEHERPQLILSDVRMPGMDGFEFYRRVQSLPALRTVPFIFMSALDDIPHIRIGKELGADDYLPKPVRLEELLATVRGKLRRAELRADSMKDELEGLKRQIIATISHEFRSPLANIIGFSEILFDERYRFSESELKETARIIKTEGNRLKSLLEEFLLTLQIEAGFAAKRRALEKQPTSLTYLATAIVDEYLPRAQGLGISIELTAADTPVECAICQEQVWEALTRVVENAVQFTRLGGAIRVSTRREGGKCVLEVSDNGMGIPESELPRVFDKFYQVNRTKFEQQGMGLGLYIAKNFVEINQGTISVASTEGAGTTFRMEFSGLD